MPVFHVLALPVPQGVVGGKNRLSVYFSLRLREAGNISQYPDIDNWPSRINTVQKFWVDTDAGRIQASRIGPGPSQAVWDAVFDGSAARRVKPWAYIQRDIDNVVSPATHRMDDLAEQMLRTAVLQNRSGFTKAEIRTRFAGLANVATAIAPYFDKVGNGQTPSTSTIDQDFHDSVRMLGAHPQLLRRLGLVVDLELTRSVSSSAKWVSVALEFPNGRTLGGTVVPVRMKLDSGFLPASDAKSYSNDRFLTLGASTFEVTQIESSQLAGQLADLAKPVRDASVPDSAVIDLPAFSEGGIAVVNTGARRRFGSRITSNASVEQKVDAYLRNPANNLPPLISYADVVAGVRLDVRNGAGTTGAWRSLHERRSSAGFDFPADSGLELKPDPDEGWSSSGLSTDGTPRQERKRVNISYGEVRKNIITDSTKVRLSDQLLVWNGWSLAAPKPSKSTTGDGAVESRGRQTNNAEYPGKVVIDYKPVNGSLPSLRYGASYRLRARQADITGGGPTRGASSPQNAESKIVQYGRFAPVVAPSVLRRVSRPDPGVGDEPTTLVILSDLDQATNTITPTDRLLFPPSVAQSVAERHGLPGDGTDAAAYADLAARDALSLNDQVIVDPDTNEPVAGLALVDGAVTLGGLKQPIEYLADPMAGGVAGVGLPNQSSPVAVSYGTWPNLETARLQLAAGTNAPVVSAANRTITAFLPPGTTHTCRISHTPTSSRIGHMKGVQLLDRNGHQAHDAEIARGRNEAITPSREVTLVHAVRQPTVAPNFPFILGVERVDNAIGETRVVLSGTVGVHRQTSDHLALSASWFDIVDDLAFGSPSTVHGKAYVGDVVVPTEAAAPADGDETTISIAGLTFDLDDTRRRTLTIASEAFSRYSRYFTKRRRLAAVAGATTVLDAAGISDTDIEVRNRNTDRVFEQGPDYTVDPGAGSITIVNGGGIPVGAPLQILYLPRPFTRLSTDAPSQPTTLVLVPSSVPPSPPVVRTVVPAFHRADPTVTASTITAVNDGRVVRVQLERPWFSSGEEEKLAVVIDENGSLTSEATVWGRDPIVDPPGATVQPALGNFPLVSSTDENVDGGAFHAAVHEVSYDDARDIWICDVLVDAAFSYRPFVQLAVARYQAQAVPGAHMSPAVSCVPTRLGVRRETVVTKGLTNRVSITVTGPDSGANTMRVLLQRRVVSSNIDELFNWVDVRNATFTRSGTSAAATFTATDLDTTAAGVRRLVIEESEPVDVQSGASTTASSLISFREVLLLPVGW